MEDSSHTDLFYFVLSMGVAIIALMGVTNELLTAGKFTDEGPAVDPLWLPFTNPVMVMVTVVLLLFLGMLIGWSVELLWRNK